MKLAIFLDSLDFEDIAMNIIKVLMFDVDDKVILSIGEETLSLNNTGYLMMLLISNDIITVYADNISDKQIELFRQAGIEHKALRELKGNPIFRSFLID